MSNLRTQNAIEQAWKMPLADVLARQFARLHTVYAVAASLDVAPATICNWLYQIAQYRADWHGLTPRAIGNALAAAYLKKMQPVYKALEEAGL
jgi:hypothetical protein